MAPTIKQGKTTTHVFQVLLVLHSIRIGGRAYLKPSLPFWQRSSLMLGSWYHLFLGHWTVQMARSSSFFRVRFSSSMNLTRAISSSWHKNSTSFHMGMTQPRFTVTNPVVFAAGIREESALRCPLPDVRCFCERSWCGWL